MTDQDKFILSKGHAAGAMYATLWSLGLIDEAELSTFHKDGTRLSGHPPVGTIPGVLFATGSLGHGPGLAAGLALAMKLRGEAGHVFCLTSDGEWNEGSNWEALIFARHQKLSNLTIVVDLNGLQGFGSTREVADLHPLADKFRAFNVPVIELAGHDVPAMQAQLMPAQLTPAQLMPAQLTPAQPTPAQLLSGDQQGPRIVVANTVKGGGVSFMEHKMEWHYLPMNAQQYAQAVEEVGAIHQSGARHQG